MKKIFCYSDQNVIFIKKTKDGNISYFEHKNSVETTKEMLKKFSKVTPQKRNLEEIEKGEALEEETQINQEFEQDFMVQIIN